MNETIQTALVLALSGAITSVAGAVTVLVRGGIKKAEEYASTHLQPTQAAHANDLLETIDRLAEAVVQDGNSRVVNGLKAQGIFTAETATSVKEAAVRDVLANLGAVKEQSAAVLGDLPQIVGQVVEKHVMLSKQQNKTPV